MRHATNSYIQSCLIANFAHTTSSGGQLKTVTFSIYSPTSSSNFREADSLYHCLSDTIVATRRYHMLLVCSDFNVTLAPDDAGSKLCPWLRLNCSWDLLRDLVDGTNLVTVNTQFLKPRCQLVTFYWPRGRQACLDHILVQWKWCSSFLDCKTKQVHNFKSNHAALTWGVIGAWPWKGKVSRCIPQDRDTLCTNQECHAEFISQIKGSCGPSDGEVHHLLPPNVIRTAATSTII